MSRTRTDQPKKLSVEKIPVPKPKSEPKPELDKKEIEAWYAKYNKVIVPLEAEAHADAKKKRSKHFKRFNFQQIDGFFEGKLKSLEALYLSLQLLPQTKENASKIALLHFYRGIALYFSAYNGAIRNEEKIIEAHSYLKKAIEMSKTDPILAKEEPELKFGLATRLRYFLFQAKYFSLEPDSLTKSLVVLDGLLDGYNLLLLLEDQEEIFYFATVLTKHYWHKRLMPQTIYWFSILLNSPATTENTQVIDEVISSFKVDTRFYSLPEQTTVSCSEFQDIEHLLWVFLTVNCPDNKKIMMELIEISKIAILLYRLTSYQAIASQSQHFIDFFAGALYHFEQPVIDLAFKRMSYCFNMYNVKLTDSKVRLIDETKANLFSETKLKDLVAFNRFQASFTGEEKNNNNFFSELLRKKPTNKLESNIAYISIYLQENPITDHEVFLKYNHIVDKIIKEYSSVPLAPSMKALIDFNRGIPSFFIRSNEYDLQTGSQYLKKAFESVQKDIDFYSVLQFIFLNHADEYPANRESHVEFMRGFLNILKPINTKGILIEIYCRFLNTLILFTNLNEFFSVFSEAIALHCATEKDIEKLVTTVFLATEIPEKVVNIGPHVIITLLTSRFSSAEFVEKAVDHFDQRCDHLIQDKKCDKKMTGAKRIVDYVIRHVKPQDSMVVEKIKTHFFEQKIPINVLAVQKMIAELGLKGIKAYAPPCRIDEANLQRLNEWKAQADSAQSFLTGYQAFKKELTEGPLDCKNIITRVNELFELARKIGPKKPAKYQEITANLFAEEADAGFLLAYQKAPRDEKIANDAHISYKKALQTGTLPHVLRRDILDKIIKTMKKITEHAGQKEVTLQDLNALVEVVKNAINEAEIVFLEQACMIFIDHYHKIKGANEAYEIAKKINTDLMDKFPMLAFSSVYQYCQAQEVQKEKIKKYIDLVNQEQCNCKQWADESDKLLANINQELKKCKELAAKKTSNKTKMDLVRYRPLFQVADYISQMSILKDLIAHRILFLQQRIEQLQKSDFFDKKEEVQKKLLAMKVFKDKLDKNVQDLASLSQDLEKIKNKVDKKIQEKINYQKNISEDASHKINKIYQDGLKPKSRESEKLDADHKKAIELRSAFQKAQSAIAELKENKKAIMALDLGLSSTSLKINFMPDRKPTGLAKKVQSIGKIAQETKEKELIREKISESKKEKNKLKENLAQIQKGFQTLETELNQMTRVTPSTKTSLVQKTVQFNALYDQVILQYNKVPTDLKQIIQETVKIIKKCEYLIEVCQIKERDEAQLAEQKAQNAQLNKMAKKSQAEITGVLTELKEPSLDNYKKLLYKTKKIQLLLRSACVLYQAGCDDQLRHEVDAIDEVIESMLKQIKDFIDLSNKKLEKKALLIPTEIKVPAPLRPFFSESKNNPHTLYEYFTETPVTHEYEWFCALVKKFSSQGKQLELKSLWAALEVAKQQKVPFKTLDEAKINVDQINLSLEFESDEEREKIKEILLEFGFVFNQAGSSPDMQELNCCRRGADGIKKFNFFISNKKTPQKNVFLSVQGTGFIFVLKKYVKEKDPDYLCDIDDLIAIKLKGASPLRMMLKNKKFSTRVPDLDNMEQYTDYFLDDLFRDMIEDQSIGNRLFGINELDSCSDGALNNKKGWTRTFFEKRHANIFLKSSCYFAVAKLINYEWPLNSGKIPVQMFLSVVLQAHTQQAVLKGIFPDINGYDHLAKEWLLPFIELVFQEVPSTLEAIIEKLYFAIKFILKSVAFHGAPLGIEPFSDFSCPQSLFYQRFQARLASSPMSPSALCDTIEAEYQHEFSSCLSNLTHQVYQKESRSQLERSLIFLPVPVPVPAPRLLQPASQYILFAPPVVQASIISSTMGQTTSSTASQSGTSTMNQINSLRHK